jgi:hypothetical protein
VSRYKAFYQGLSVTATICYQLIITTKVWSSSMINTFEDEDKGNIWTRCRMNTLCKIFIFDSMLPPLKQSNVCITFSLISQQSLTLQVLYIGKEHNLLIAEFKKANSYYIHKPIWHHVKDFNFAIDSYQVPALFL